MAPIAANSCPMCGVSISEIMPQCPACGEVLVNDGIGRPLDSIVDTGFAKARRRRLMWMLGISIAVGIAAELFPDVHEEILILGSIGIIVVVGSWCDVDARELDYTI